MTTSVIPTWISTYDSAAYTSLVAQESYAYSANPTEWPPFFQELANGLNAWFGTNRSGDISNLIGPVYQAYVMNQLYGTSIPSLSAYDGLVIFSVAGFLTATASRPSTYYNDLIATTTGTPPNTTTTYSSVKMTADLATVTGAITTEEATIKTLIAGIQGSVQGVITNLLFQDPPAPLNPVTKASIATYIFDTLHYKQVYQNLSISPLTLPSGV
jgi:hypothetical protein